jgi:hypothetical protein
MKPKSLLQSLVLAAVVSTAGRAATNTFVFQNLALAIPDGDPLGVVDNRILEIPEPYVRSLTVSLDLGSVEGSGWVGDLFVSLQHGSGYSVLLNRIGTRAGDAFGAASSAAQIQFSTGATTDIHALDALLSPGEPYPATITGAFQADGRLVDPLSVDVTSPRLAGLESFQGVGTGGTWTLFLSDVVSGNAMRLNSWSLTVESSTQAIPEPSTWGAVGFLAAIAGHLYRRRTKQSGPPGSGTFEIDAASPNWTHPPIL